MTSDYSKGTMQFKWGDGFVTLTTEVDEQVKKVGLKNI